MSATETAAAVPPSGLPLAQGWRPFDPTALIRSVRPATPLEPGLNLGLDREVLLKREDLGPNGAFKWRGALCACAAFRRAGATGVVTSSTGNHGAATAWAATRLGMRAHVVVPENANPAKCELIERGGGTLLFVGQSLDESATEARRLGSSLGIPFFEDGRCEAQLWGTGTIGVELDGAGADVVITPLACGALAGGLARALASISRPPRVIGIQSTSFPRLGRLLRGEPDPGHVTGASFADGLADSRIVEPAYSACRGFMHEVRAVDDADLRAAVRELHDRAGLLVEGAAAAPLAALRRWPELAGKRTVLIVSGRNLDRTVRDEILREPV